MSSYGPLKYRALSDEAYVKFPKSFYEDLTPFDRRELLGDWVVGLNDVFVDACIENAADYEGISFEEASKQREESIVKSRLHWEKCLNALVGRRIVSFEILPDGAVAIDTTDGTNTHTTYFFQGIAQVVTTEIGVDTIEKPLDTN